MKVFFYYYYLFYLTFLDPVPILAARLALSGIETIFITGALSVFLAQYFCINLTVGHMIAIAAAILLLNTLHFYNSKRAYKIIRDKPSFFNNKRLSIILVLFISLAVISTLFWTGRYVHHALYNCRGYE